MSNEIRLPPLPQGYTKTPEGYIGQVWIEGQMREYGRQCADQQKRHIERLKRGIKAIAESVDFSQARRMATQLSSQDVQYAYAVELTGVLQPYGDPGETEFVVLAGSREEAIQKAMDRCEYQSKGAIVTPIEEFLDFNCGCVSLGDL